MLVKLYIIEHKLSFYIITTKPTENKKAVGFTVFVKIVRYTETFLQHILTTNEYYGALHLVHFMLHGSYKCFGALHLIYFKVCTLSNICSIAKVQKVICALHKVYYNLPYRKPMHRTSPHFCTRFLYLCAIWGKTNFWKPYLFFC